MDRSSVSRSASEPRSRPKGSRLQTTLVRSAAAGGRIAVPIENLDHLALQLTRARGASLVTYYVHDVLAASTLLLRGEDQPAEADLMQMFVQSLRGSALVARLAQPDPLAALFSLHDRPLHVVVPWVQDEIEEDDAGLVQELSAHVAGVLLTDPSN